MFYEDALTAARALELTLTSRSKDASGGAIPMCGVPFHAADGYIARLVKQGLPRRRLRAGRGPAQGQGPRQARSRPRGLARHAHRRRLSRRPRAGVPGGGGAGRGGRAPAGGVALLDLSTGEFAAAEYHGRRRRARRSPTSSPSCGRAKCSCRRTATDVDALPADRLARRPRDPRRGLDLRRRVGAPDAARAASRRSARRASASTATRRRRRAAGALVHYLRDTQKADLAHVRDDRLPRRRRLPAHRSRRRSAPRSDRSRRRRPRPVRCSTRSIAR